MRSSHCFEETVEQLRRHTTAEPFNEKDTITWLQRGGCVIKTKIGYIQTGMPPETIKDTIVLGNEVPQYYIVLDKFFDTNSRLNSCEFEFPAYFNFFIKRKKATFICTKQGENAMRTVFQETLLGPKTLEVCYYPPLLYLLSVSLESLYFSVPWWLLLILLYLLELSRWFCQLFWKKGDS